MRFMKDPQRIISDNERLEKESYALRIRLGKLITHKAWLELQTKLSEG